MHARVHFFFFFCMNAPASGMPVMCLRELSYAYDASTELGGDIQ